MTRNRAQHASLVEEPVPVFFRDGDFVGVEGVIKRVKRNKHVVVQLEGLVAVAIAYIPGAYLQLID